MNKKISILDITFWVSLVVLLVNFYILTQIADSGNIEFIDKTKNIIYWAGAVGILSYLLCKPQSYQSNEDK